MEITARVANLGKYAAGILADTELSFPTTTRRVQDALRKIGVDENGNPYPVVDYEVSGEEITVVEMIPGYTHNLINLSDTEDLVTLMWANEPFDPEHPDTFAEPV